MAMTPVLPIKAPAQGDGVARAEPDRIISTLCDAAFVLATLATASWWFWRLSRRFFFAYDDWSVAGRPGTLGDLYKPHNQQLSVVPLLVYRGMLSVFGLESYAPYRLLGILCLVTFATALYLLARTRLGAVPALAIGVCVLWLPSTTLTPFLFNYYVPLALAVLCCWQLPSESSRADIVIFVSLVVALCTSGVGVAIAAACIAHTAMRPRLTRAFASTLPLAGWIVWHFKFGDGTRQRTSTLHAIDLVSRGIFGSFEDLVLRSAFLGVVLCAACGVLLAWRIRNDRASARLQIAWLVALLVWWSGLAWSRIDHVGFAGTARYRMVGSVFVLLSLIPGHRVQVRVKLGLQLAAAAAILLAFVSANRADIAVSARDRTTVSTWARDDVVEMQQGGTAIPDSKLMPVELDGITAARYRNVLTRYGTPLAFQTNPDAFLIANGALAVRFASPHAPAASCKTGPVTLHIGERVTVHASLATSVTARRFGAADQLVRNLKAGTTATIATWGSSVSAVPWTISVANACTSSQTGSGGG